MVSYIYRDVLQVSCSSLTLYRFDTVSSGAGANAELIYRNYSSEYQARCSALSMTTNSPNPWDSQAPRQSLPFRPVYPNLALSVETYAPPRKDEIP